MWMWICVNDMDIDIYYMSEKSELQEYVGVICWPWYGHITPHMPRSLSNHLYAFLISPTNTLFTHISIQKWIILSITMWASVIPPLFSCPPLNLALIVCKNKHIVSQRIPQQNLRSVIQGRAFINTWVIDKSLKEAGWRQWRSANGEGSLRG